MAEVQTQTHVDDNRTLGELFSELSQETRTLVRQEVRLAKSELSEKASAAGRNIAAIVAGALILYAGFLALILAVIYALAGTMEPWIAALLVGLVVAGGGIALAYYGLEQLKKMNFVPQRTVETVEENAEWLKQQVG